MAEMVKRIISGIIASVLTLWIIFMGDLPFLCLIAILVCWGILEYADLMKRQGMRTQTWVMIISSMLLLVAIYLVYKFALRLPGLPSQNAERLLAFGLMGTFFVIIGNELLRGIPEHGLANTAANLFGVVYIGFTFAYMLLIRFLPKNDGLIYILFTVMVTWLNDSAAYFIGINFGKHKLSPRISPNKSIEGSIAGFAGGVLTALILGLICHKSLPGMAIMGVVTVMAGQLGDLMESIIKRNAGVKDSGSFLPGHGGVLDRIDSLLTVAPIVYYMATYIMPHL